MKAKKQIKKLKEALSEQRSLLKEIHHEIFKDKKFSIGKPFDSKELTFEGTGSLSKDVLRGITEPKYLDSYVHEKDSNTLKEMAEYANLNFEPEEKPFVLPGKWCVKSDEKILVDYCNAFGVRKGLYTEENLSYNYAHFPCFEYNSSYCTTSPVIEKGYTEITFEQFLEHVVNASTEPQSASTEVSTEPTATSTEPKPVESDTFKNLKLEDVQVNVEDCSEEKIKELADIFVANGFEMSSLHNFKRNPSLRYLYLSLSLDDSNDSGIGIYYPQTDKTTLTPSQFREMFGKKDIDWDVEGQFVQTKIGTVYRTTGFHKDDAFGGVFVTSKKILGLKFGDRNNNLSKRCFTLCTEPITLNN